MHAKQFECHGHPVSAGAGEERQKEKEQWTRAEGGESGGEQ